MRIKEIILLISIICFVSPSFARADTNKDIETITKAIGFIDNGPTGTVQMDILYNPSNPESIAHANEILTLIQQTKNDGKVTLTGAKIQNATAATSPLIFITRGTKNMHKAALKQAAKNHGLTVSTDESCLGSGCVLVIKTQPHIDIFISQTASEITGTKFSMAFKMMATRK